MPLDKKDILLGVIFGKQKGPPRKSLPVKLRGEIPQTLQMSREELATQLEGIRLVEKCVPNQIVQDLERTYDEQKTKLMMYQPDDYNPLQVTEHILEQRRSLANEKNSKKQKCIEETIKRWSSWSDQLSQHQEDAIYIQHTESYVALWIKGSRYFAVRYGLGGTFCVMEVTKVATRTVLTNRAFLGMRYRGTGFSIIAKYDRREAVENTTFEKIRKIGHGQWLVVDKDGLGVNVSEVWVLNDTNIPLICYNEAKQRYSNGDMAMVIIPPGSSNSLQVVAPCGEGGLQLGPPCGDLPPVVYRNMPGEHKCLENCFISAMHFIGYPEIGKRIRNLLDRTEATTNSGSPFLQDVANKILIQYDMKLVKNNKLNRYDPRAIANAKSIETKGKRIVVAKLKGRNSGINHAVCFVNDGLIFDANHSFALPLSEESLQKVCDGAGYRSLYWSYRLIGKGIGGQEDNK